MGQQPQRETSLLQRLAAKGINRRDFVKTCGAAAATVGIPISLWGKVARAATSPKRPSVIWLHFQECTGCSETLLRSSHPAIAELLLDMISLDYHETLLAGAGKQAEAALHGAMQANQKKYICVVEGAIPTKDGGIYCKIGGKTASKMLQEVAAGALATIAVGSCASFGGLPAAAPNPTGAKGVPDLLAEKTILTLPGCPPSPYNLLGVILHFATLGTLPALDRLGRPRFAYARTIHEDCPRRPHFDAGRFAKRYGDGAHRQGHCLYQLGCKGPRTHARCSLRHFGEVVGAWPIGVGHPCIGCTEQSLAFRIPLHDTIPIDTPTIRDGVPATGNRKGGVVDPLAAGLAGAICGAAIGAGWVASRRLSEEPPPPYPDSQMDEE